MSKWSRYEVTAEIDLDYELSDDDLLEMAKDRGLIGGRAAAPDAKDTRLIWDDLAEELRAAAARGDSTHFEVTLLRLETLANIKPLPGAPPLFDAETRAALERMQ